MGASTPGGAGGSVYGCSTAHDGAGTARAPGSFAAFAPAAPVAPAAAAALGPGLARYLPVVGAVAGAAAARSSLRVLLSLVVAGSLEFNVGEKRAPLSVTVGIPQAAVLGDVGEADEGVAAGAGLEELQELVVAEAAASAAARELLLGERARRPSLVIARDAVHLVDGFVALLAQVRLILHAEHHRVPRISVTHLAQVHSLVSPCQLIRLVNLDVAPRAQLGVVVEAEHRRRGVVA
mmetsp:Transcript_9814/g.39761  ORF Transcript_9814/g.39761 Transcript_9814/m.39761 type:complete len:236 (-) Transcript_9814:318-1025(-)